MTDKEFSLSSLTIRGLPLIIYWKISHPAQCPAVIAPNAG